MTKRAWIENHYGILEISGPDMIETGKKQAQKFSAEIITSSVGKIEKMDAGFTVTTEDKGSFEAKHIIFATGVSLKVAEDSGVLTKDGTESRIKTVLNVNEKGQTNIPGIWAAGTCTG